MTLVQVVAKKDKMNAPKMLVFKTFWSTDFFLARLPRMSFHAETLQAYKTFVKVFRFYSSGCI
jgi:hypothetical protein